MKKNVQKIVVSLCIVTFAVTLITGCEEQNLADTRKTKLIATENLHLKEQLEQCNRTIQQQKEELEKCRKGRDFWENYSKKADKPLDALSNEHLNTEKAELRRENNELKNQVEKLKNELEQLKK